ncbi:hypothetical protein SDC9_206938 [bioreactor metagenome]|uniref:Uncharacterized protein n=1 Tax=bioreactor metagenome TaxID=1076179 RepID=A0A645J743_9ZZZZ
MAARILVAIVKFLPYLLVSSIVFILDSFSPEKTEASPKVSSRIMSNEEKSYLKNSSYAVVS